jgi:hypothetical protein
MYEGVKICLHVFLFSPLDGHLHTPAAFSQRVTPSLPFGVGLGGRTGGLDAVTQRGLCPKSLKRKGLLSLWFLAMLIP